MMLRSSSTPILGSLLSSFSDSPNNNTTHFHDTTNSYLLKHGSFNKLPYHHYHRTGSINLATVSCNSSPMSTTSVADFSNLSTKGFRRAQSDGNLEGLAYASCSNNEDRYKENQQPKEFSGKSKCLVLETIPSFSFYGLNSRYEEEEEEEEEWSEIEDEEEIELWGEDVAEEGNCFVISNNMGDTVCSEEVKSLEGIWNLGYKEENVTIGEKMYIAGGLGIDGGINNGNIGGRGGGDDSGRSHFRGGEGGDMNQTEEYYKKMLQDNPENPLILRNYAQFLCQTKQDLPKAEEYYSRAILADPKDGELLSQYAKLVWELHHDQDKALSYFERAVQASHEDSHVHAAYASFLWQIVEDENECSVPLDLNAKPPSFHGEFMASISA